MPTQYEKKSEKKARTLNKALDILNKALPIQLTFQGKDIMDNLDMVLND